MADQTVVSCLMIPSQPVALLLPSVYVAEVVMVANAELSDGDDTTLARLEWHGMNIPVLSVGLLADREAETITEFGRLIVFYPLASAKADAFFAIYTESDPRTHLVDGTVQPQEHNMEQPGSDLAMMFIDIDDKTVAIPDLSQIQKSISALTDLRPEHDKSPQ